MRPFFTEHPSPVLANNLQLVLSLFLFSRVSLSGDVSEQRDMEFRIDDSSKTLKQRLDGKMTEIVKFRYVTGGCDKRTGSTSQRLQTDTVLLTGQCVMRVYVCVRFVYMCEAVRWRLQRHPLGNLDRAIVVLMWRLEGKQTG